MKLKLSNPATKTPGLQSGHIQRRRVRCGKPNCRCVRGEPHTAFYHVWHADGQRYQKYVRRTQINDARAACEAHRELQATLRAGRAEYKRTLAYARALFKEFSL